MPQQEPGVWTPAFPSASWIECEVDGDRCIGFVTAFDAEDGQYHVIVPPEDPSVDTNDFMEQWIDHEDAFRLAATPEYVTSDGGQPKYIFMVIRPGRKINIYANLDSLIDGMVKVGMPAADKEQAVRELAVQAIADPETDMKLPGANIWVRFTQVEGA
jgi:hypothetical protein